MGHVRLVSPSFSPGAEIIKCQPPIGQRRAGQQPPRWPPRPNAFHACARVEHLDNLEPVSLSLVVSLSLSASPTSTATGAMPALTGLEGRHTRPILGKRSAREAVNFYRHARCVRGTTSQGDPREVDDTDRTEEPKSGGCRSPCRSRPRPRGAQIWASIGSRIRPGPPKYHASGSAGGNDAPRGPCSLCEAEFARVFGRLPLLDSGFDPLLKPPKAGSPRATNERCGAECGQLWANFGPNFDQPVDFGVAVTGPCWRAYPQYLPPGAKRGHIGTRVL